MSVENERSNDPGHTMEWAMKVEKTRVVCHRTGQSVERGNSMRSSNYRDESDGEYISDLKQRTIKYSVSRKPHSRPRSKVKRPSTDQVAKRGIHQRRNKPMGW